MLSDLEIALVVGVEQVADLLLVDLSVGDLLRMSSASDEKKERAVKLASTVKDSLSVESAVIRSKRASQMRGIIPRSAPYPIIE